MLRQRVKDLARKAALRAFGMEGQASPHAVQSERLSAPPASVDPNVIPRVVDGSGDTPGPNHKTDVGRTILAAQVVSAAPPVILDIRHPEECAGGMLPFAVLMPGEQLKARLAELPDKAARVVVYDQLGGPESDTLAAWLREQGWGQTRRLRGGYAEWIEHGEPITIPTPPPGGRWAIGQMVERVVGGRAWVLHTALEGGAPRYWLLGPDGAQVGPVGEREILA